MWRSKISCVHYLRHPFHDDDVFDVTVLEHAGHEAVQVLLGLLVGKDMQGEGQGEETDPIKAIFFH